MVPTVAVDQDPLFALRCMRTLPKLGDRIGDVGIQANTKGVSNLRGCWHSFVILRFSSRPMGMVGTSGCLISARQSVQPCSRAVVGVRIARVHIRVSHFERLRAGSMVTG